MLLTSLRESFGFRRSFSICLIYIGESMTLLLANMKSIAKLSLSYWTSYLSWNIFPHDGVDHNVEEEKWENVSLSNYGQDREFFRRFISNLYTVGWSIVWCLKKLEGDVFGCQCFRQGRPMDAVECWLEIDEHNDGSLGTLSSAGWWIFDYEHPRFGLNPACSLRGVCSRYLLTWWSS